MDDRRLETIIGNLLRAGVLLAAAVVLAGGALYLVQHHSDKVSYRTLSSNHKGFARFLELWTPQRIFRAKD